MMLSVLFDVCPESAPFFGFMGVTSALVFANLGASYGTAKSGRFTGVLTSICLLHPSQLPRLLR